MNAYYNIDETEEGMAKISERLKDLIRAILVPDPQKRYNLKQVKQVLDEQLFFLNA